MQCDPTCSTYSPCISSCPVDTCDNILQNKEDRMCKEDTCVEGCQLKKCEEGYVYSNISFSECVPKASCRPICMTLKGITYYEGDIISTDNCHTCTCSRGKKMCTGVPCSIPIPIIYNDVCHKLLKLMAIIIYFLCYRHLENQMLVVFLAGQAG